MTNENLNDMKNLWQNAAPTSFKMSIEELRQKSSKLEKTVAWRNAREYVAAAFVAVIFGFYFWKFQTPMIRLGSVLTVAGALRLSFQLHKRGSARVTPAEMALSSSIDFHRKELERQRDLLLNVWQWYLTPLLPGLVLFLAGLMKFVLEQPNAQLHSGLIVTVFTVTTLMCAGVFVGIGKLNKNTAHKLQHQIDALGALSKDA